MGKLLVDNVNATIASRSSHAAADVWAVATQPPHGRDQYCAGQRYRRDGLQRCVSGQVQAEVTTALGAYDVPTGTDLAAEIDTVQGNIAALND